MKWIELSWKADAFIDTWSFVHLAWGIILGIVFSYFNFTPLQSLGSSIALMVVWEIFEKVVHTSENWANISSDLLVGIVGFAIGYALIPKFFESKLLTVLTIVSIIMLVMEFLGWRAYLSR